MRGTFARKLSIWELVWGLRGLGFRVQGLGGSVIIISTFLGLLGLRVSVHGPPNPKEGAARSRTGVPS